MPSEAANEMTRKEWRELGFFYDRDDAAKEWRLIGSVEGLLKFADILHDYASNPKNEGLSEHDHLGPYMYLKIGKWNVPVITDDWMAGTLGDLLRLSSVLKEALESAKENDMMKFKNVFSPLSSYELILEVRNKFFDPPSADSQL